MGVVNVTPDSFSDGGRWFSEENAVAHGRELLAQGADLLDIGGESTRPGAERPPEGEELRRVVPVVSALAAEGAVISVDTMRASVAAAALRAGASLLNDVSGGLADPDMAALAAETGAPYVAMHWRGHSTQMERKAVYADVVAEVRDEQLERVDGLRSAGLPDEQIILDPGFGFAKNADHNWTLLAHLEAFLGLGHQLMVGTSRKRFLGSVGREPGSERPPRERDVATAVTSFVAARAGVWCIRVHDVPSTVDALDVAAALASAGGVRR
jgi:dihydropteroate synthase